MGGALRISPVFLDEVGLQGCGDFVGRLQRVVGGPVPCSVVNHGASIARVCPRHRARLPASGALSNSPAFPLPLSGSPNWHWQTAVGDNKKVARRSRGPR